MEMVVRCDGIWGYLFFSAPRDKRSVWGHTTLGPASSLVLGLPALSQSHVSQVWGPPCSNWHQFPISALICAQSQDPTCHRH